MHTDGHRWNKDPICKDSLILGALAVSSDSTHMVLKYHCVNCNGTGFLFANKYWYDFMLL